jgi:prepilin signal peptidase PulO-like enzyme (type II secretory pathway)
MIEIIIAIFVFCLGTIIGSFLNVVVLRYQTGLSAVKGQSICFSCSKTLCWYELFPIFSFLAQRGRCRKCLSKISWQYPVVEFITACLFLSVYLNLGGLNAVWWQLILTLIFVSFLIIISVYDLKHKIIPDGWSLSLAVVAVIYTALSLWPTAGHGSFWGWLAGPILAAPLALLWLVSGGRWMGLGDGKLLLGLGWFLGLSQGLTGMILGFWLGALYGVFIMFFGLSLFGKKITIKSEVPFAPFLILGFLLAYFTGWDLLNLGLFL